MMPSELPILQQAPCRDSGLVQRKLWNVVWRPAQSGLAPENFTTLAHFPISAALSLPYSTGESASALPPKSARRALILGSANAALISRLSLSTISGGVFLGMPTPFTTVAS